MRCNPWSCPNGDAQSYRAWVSYLSLVILTRRVRISVVVFWVPHVSLLRHEMYLAAPFMTRSHRGMGGLPFARHSDSKSQNLRRYPSGAPHLASECSVS